jgi:hypothetical protein
MLNRRNLATGALALAAVSSFSRIATAAGRPMLVFVGHEL